MSQPAERGLILMPDISGYTAFVHAAHADHARRITARLLEALIDANRLGLQLSDAEGDALFFFRPGELPPFESIVGQAHHWYRAFHRVRESLDRNTRCDCGACASLAMLTVKVVGHHGRMGVQRIGHLHKLFGRDVILAHRLLKNSLPDRSYFLFTDALAVRCGVGVTERYGCNRHEELYPVFGRTALNVIALPLAPRAAGDEADVRLSRSLYLDSAGNGERSPVTGT